MRTWKPTAPLLALEARAQLYQTIRTFFAERGVLEVETPILSEFGVTDVHLENIEAQYGSGAHRLVGYLQTSPEYAMKRLLAHHQKAIYQLCKVFRHDELGRLHNPEFTMLEWYRPGFDHHALMDEMDQLLQTVLGSMTAERISYQALFMRELALDPLSANVKHLLQVLQQHDIDLSPASQALGKDELLQLIMSYLIEPKLGRKQPTFVYDYPRSQAALAKISKTNPLVAERFEVYVEGIELANGFHELCDAKEQLARFTEDQALRRAEHRPHREIDHRLIDALHVGIPDAAGVALGIDRLLMLKRKARSIDEVISFCWGNA